MAKRTQYQPDTRRPPGDFDRTIGDRALAAVVGSLRQMGLPTKGRVAFGRDERGYRIDVKADGVDLKAARLWLADFGRSYGPVRIFLAECR